MRRADKTAHPANLRGEDMRKWPIVGKRQRAIARGLTRPMTTTALAAAVIPQFPAIERTQVAQVLSLFIKRGLARCVNPQTHFGKLYELTQEGVAELRRICPLADIHAAKHDSVDDRVFAAVHRSVVLTKIMIQMNRHSRDGPIDGSILRRWLSRHYPICFPVFRRGLRKLEGHGLLRYLGKTLIGRHNLFMITESGKAVAARLMKETWN